MEDTELRWSPIFSVSVFGVAPRSVAARIAGRLAALGLPPDPTVNSFFRASRAPAGRGSRGVGKRPVSGGSSQSLATDRLSERQPSGMLNPKAFPRQRKREVNF